MKLPRKIRRFLRKRFIRMTGSWLIAQYIRLVWLTSRWDVVGEEYPSVLWQNGKAGIIAFWHGRLMMMPYAWKRGVPFNMLSSPHPDGQIIAYAVRNLGISNIFGSSSRGGSAALRGILGSLKDSQSIGITPEGPRGPRMRVTQGTIAIARLSGVPIYPLTFSARRHRIFQSWDRFLLPFPFGKGIFIWGEPLSIPREVDEETLEALRLELENRMNAITAEADRRMGFEPVEPAASPVNNELSASRSL